MKDDTVWVFPSFSPEVMLVLVLARISVWRSNGLGAVRLDIDAELLYRAEMILLTVKSSSACGNVLLFHVVASKIRAGGALGWESNVYKLLLVVESCQSPMAKGRSYPILPFKGIMQANIFEHIHPSIQCPRTLDPGNHWPGDFH